MEFLHVGAGITFDWTAGALTEAGVGGVEGDDGVAVGELFDGAWAWAEAATEAWSLETAEANAGDRLDGIGAEDKVAVAPGTK